MACRELVERRSGGDGRATVRVRVREAPDGAVMPSSSALCVVRKFEPGGARDVYSTAEALAAAMAAMAAAAAATATATVDGDGGGGAGAAARRRRQRGDSDTWRRWRWRWRRRRRWRTRCLSRYRAAAVIFAAAAKSRPHRRRRCHSHAAAQSTHKLAMSTPAALCARQGVRTRGASGASWQARRERRAKSHQRRARWTCALMMCLSVMCLQRLHRWPSVG